MKCELRGCGWVIRTRKPLAGATRKLTPAESQCAEDFHYSWSDPASAENYFQKMEQRYCSCIDALRKEVRLTPAEYGNLLVCMFDLNLRNFAHVNRSDREGFETYQTRWQLFYNNLLFAETSSPRTKDQISDHISQFWQLMIVRCPPDSTFLTSDNPSIWFSVCESPKVLHGVVLPLTPNILAISYDRRFVWFRDRTLSATDVAGLNGQQIANAITALYSSRELSLDEQQQVQHHFKTATPASQTEFTNDIWIAKLRDWTETPQLNFINPIPPKL